AILCVLQAPGSLRRPLIVADPEPLTLPDMVTALRRGLGRRPAIIPIPVPMIGALFRAAGKSELYDSFAGPLVASPAALPRLGWVPTVTSNAGLEKLMRRHVRME